MTDAHNRKPDEPRNPQGTSTDAPYADAPERQPAVAETQPPDGYADPLRREKGSGLVDTPDPARENARESGSDLETTLGDRGGAG